MARPAVATATAVSSIDVVKEYGTGRSAVHAVRKANVLALRLLIVPLDLWDTPQALMPARPPRCSAKMHRCTPSRVRWLTCSPPPALTHMWPPRNRSCAGTSPSPPPPGLAPRARRPANLTGVLHPAGRIVLAAIIEEVA
jgi:hypothetical protein